jgi:membrane associated rhomboid family serine protease
VLLIAANVTVFLLQMLVLGAGGQDALNQAIFDFGVVPGRVASDPLPWTLLTFVTSMFMHGGFMHIIGNMLYLWIFGNNVEDVMGRFWFTVFYFACGFAASAAQVLVSAGSDVPGIGASGAIAGVLAAYLIFFPGARVETLIFLGYFTSIRAVPAIVVLGLWFVLQIFNGFLSFGAGAATGGVAWFAHIGGFVAGLVLALPWIAKARRMERRSWYH